MTKHFQIGTWLALTKVGHVFFEPFLQNFTSPSRVFDPKYFHPVRKRRGFQPEQRGCAACTGDFPASMFECGNHVDLLLLTKLGIRYELCFTSRGRV